MTPTDLKLFNKLAKEAESLCDKLDAVTEASNGVFVLAAIHGHEYTGPNYTEELTALRSALAELWLSNRCFNEPRRCRIQTNQMKPKGKSVDEFCNQPPGSFRKFVKVQTAFEKREEIRRKERIRKAKAKMQNPPPAE